MAKGYSIRVRIGGRSYRIISDEKPEYLNDVAESVDKSISGMMTSDPKMTFERAAVLSALKFCDDAKKGSIPVKDNDENSNNDEDNLRQQVMEYSNELSKLTREYKKLEKELERLKEEYNKKIIEMSDEFESKEKELRQLTGLM